MSRRLDVIIPVFNSSNTLALTLRSLAVAERPRGMDVRLIVVDNNSRADEAARTADLVSAVAASKCRLIHERRQGSSFARNRGIVESDAEWIGFVDADEQVEPNWYHAVAQHLADERVDFLGGPYLPDWGAPPPRWLPALAGRYIAAVGWVEVSPSVVQFSRDTDAIAMSGNFVVRRRVIDRVGMFATELGRVGNRLLCGEDRDMHERLLRAGCLGLYVPELAIRHHIPASRLTRAHHRRWAFWHGYSLQRLDSRRERSVPFLFGVPRHVVGRSFYALPRMGAALVTGRIREPSVFADQLDAIELMGRLYSQLCRSVQQPPITTVGTQETPFSL